MLKLLAQYITEIPESAHNLSVLFSFLHGCLVYQLGFYCIHSRTCPWINKIFWDWTRVCSQSCDKLDFDNWWHLEHLQSPGLTRVGMKHSQVRAANDIRRYFLTINLWNNDVIDSVIDQKAWRSLPGSHAEVVEGLHQQQVGLQWYSSLTGMQTTRVLLKNLGELVKYTIHVLIYFGIYDCDSIFKPVAVFPCKPKHYLSAILSTPWAPVPSK